MALANEHGFTAGYLRLRRLLPSSSEKPIHLWLRVARDAGANTLEVVAIDLNCPQAVQACHAVPWQSQEMPVEFVMLSYPGGFQQALVLREEVDLAGSALLRFWRFPDSQ